VGIIEEKKKCKFLFIIIRMFYNVYINCLFTIVLHLAVKKELLKEKGVPMEEDQSSDYLPINNSDATKIITPKSNGKF